MLIALPSSKASPSRKLRNQRIHSADAACPFAGIGKLLGDNHGMIGDIDATCPVA